MPHGLKARALRLLETRVRNEGKLHQSNQSLELGGKLTARVTLDFCSPTNSLETSTQRQALAQLPLASLTTRPESAEIRHVFVLPPLVNMSVVVPLSHSRAIRGLQVAGMKNWDGKHKKTAYSHANIPEALPPCNSRKKKPLFDTKLAKNGILELFG
eukprot:1330929-Amorphochlora_amoeboformis.AAC.1